MIGNFSVSRTTGMASQTKPFSSLQSAEQPSPEMVLPSSHSCPPARSDFSSSPSPHAVLQGPPAAGQTGSRRQKGEQPSPVSLLPSSHCSDPSALPSPQTVRTQGWPAVGQPHPLPSVAAGDSMMQVGLQPSPAMV